MFLPQWVTWSSWTTRITVCGGVGCGRVVSCFLITHSMTHNYRIKMFCLTEQGRRLIHTSCCTVEHWRHLRAGRPCVNLPSSDLFPLSVQFGGSQSKPEFTVDLRGGSMEWASKDKSSKKNVIEVGKSSIWSYTHFLDLFLVGNLHSCFFVW